MHVKIGGSPLSFPKIWDLIDMFKERCKQKGWNAYENEDLVETKNEYYKFIWVRSLHLSTFKKVVTSPLCAIRDGISYRTVRLTYMAWVLPETPSVSIWEMVKEAPSLSRKVAIYDLSRAYEGEFTVLKINETESVVLRRFEQFLNHEYGIKIASY